MDRRRYLEAAGLSLTVPLVGCLATSSQSADAPRSTPSADNPSETTVPEGTDATSLASRGDPSNICEREVIEEFPIRAIDRPAFADSWAGRRIPQPYRGATDDGRLPADAHVVGVARDGTQRAYPLAVLAEHEVVNGTLGGPLLVTYCPRCRSAVTARRTVRNRPAEFDVSGHLWRIDGSDYNLVMYDSVTRSFWSQILARAICGPLTGRRLQLVPSSLTTWGAWRENHASTEVLLPPPHSGTM